MARPTHAGPVWRPVPRRCLCSCQGAGVPTGCRARRSRLGRSRTLGHRVSETVAPPWLEPKGMARMTLCAWSGEERRRIGEKCCALPAHDEPAGIGRISSSRLRPMLEVDAGQARGRAEARQGLALERSFGDEHACHRNVDDPLLSFACQPHFAHRCSRRSRPGGRQFDEQ